MASPNRSESNVPISMGPGAQPLQPGESPASLLQDLREARASYRMDVETEGLKLAYSFRGQDRTYDIPFTSIPISGAAQWLLYGGPWRASMTNLFTLDQIRGAENMVGRPLTETEARGFALHSGKRMRYSFVGIFVGFAGGYGWAWSGRKTMKFPFRKPKPIERYNYFPGRVLPIISGSWARAMWQVTRGNIYAAICLIFASSFAGSMGRSVMATGLYRDSRTADVVMAMKNNFDRLRNNRSRPGQAPPRPQQQPGHDQDPQTSSDFYGNESGTMQDYQTRGTNYSGDQPFSDSDLAMNQQKLERKARQLGYSLPPQGASGSENQQGSDIFFDDASPTAGNDPDMATPGPYSSGGSVWDRIRRGGQPQSQAKPRPRQQDDVSQPIQQTTGWRRQSEQNLESKADSFSFSKSDEEKQLAKSQAQKEFDAMLERERRAGGSEGYASSSFAAESGSENPQQTSGSAWGRRRGS